jgi:hypothetical protein
MERAFTALGERLARRGVVADVFVVGGDAMALAYDATRVTRDIDATFVPHGVVIEEARHVADDLGLPYWWLNEQASIYISGKDDPGKRRVFDHPGLRVSAASAAHIFAMKALAARTRDIDDLRLLADIIGVESAEEACRSARTSIRTNHCHDGLPPSCENSSGDRANPALCPRPARQIIACRAGHHTPVSVPETLPPGRKPQSDAL